LDEAQWLNRDLSSNLDDLIAWQAEEIADMNRVALHHGEKGFLPGGQPLAVLAAHNGLVTDVVGHIAKIYRSSGGPAGLQQFWNMGTFHETVTSFRAPEMWGNFAGGNPLR
jgi:hypothetical protein